MTCHENFGLVKKIGPGDQNSRKNGPPGPFSLWTWNNGPSTSSRVPRPFFATQGKIGTRLCGNVHVGAVDKEKNFLTY